MPKPNRATELAGEVGRLVDGRRVVVALSGGVDSVTLLHLLVRGGADVRAAHVDHGLRADSADDAAFCADVAANLGLLFGHARVRIEPGNSTQGRARIQRYAALVRLATELGGDLLAVAHHADDAWESSELQLARGAGAIGASGPSVWSNWGGFEVVRPLLGHRRATIEAVAAELGLSWREDPTNADRSYARTRVRDRNGYDGEALEARRSAADELADAASLTAVATPTTWSFDRAALAGFDDGVRARLLLDAARALHGELPRPLVDELTTAVVDGERAPRWFCGRRVAVLVSSSSVAFHATRGQGTRLLDARTTPAMTVTPGRVAWFGREIETRGEHAGLVLRGPRDGDRVAGTLADLGVDPVERWSWPCLFNRERCVAIWNQANKEFQTF